MQKIKCVVSYDGTNFYGFQIQPGKRTIQGKIEKALRKIHKGESVRIQASGRTDRGVHALGQTIQFDSNFNLSESSWIRALNTLLPKDLRVLTVNKITSDFHVRYSAREKEYRYFIINQKDYDLFKRNHYYQHSHPLCIDSMQKACTYFMGTHDFTTFSSAKSTVKGNKVRTLNLVSCEKEGNHIMIRFRGDGFLYNMVRIMVSCLLDVGQGKRQPNDIPELFYQKDRRVLGKTAPAEGLYLWEVIY